MDIHKVFLFGLNLAGKTAMLRTIKHGMPVSNTNPTLAFDIETIEIENLQFQVWDAPGQQALRKTWKTGLPRAKILLFILDAADKNRFKESKEELMNVLDDPTTRGVPLVFCYHKTDLPEAKANLAEARALFQLSSLKPRKLVAYETSILDRNSLRRLESTLIDIVNGVMW